MPLRTLRLDSRAVDEQTRVDLERLWTSAFDGQFTNEDADHAYGGVHVVVRESERILSHASVVPRTILIDDRPLAAGYVEAVATLPSHQGRGLGTLVMRELDTVIEEHFDIGVLSTGEREFYLRLGWEPWRGPSYVIGDAGRTRTLDEDDGLMVLRFGVSADVDLDSPIACYDRPGDAW